MKLINEFLEYLKVMNLIFVNYTIILKVKK